MILGQDDTDCIVSGSSPVIRQIGKWSYVVLDTRGKFFTRAYTLIQSWSSLYVATEARHHASQSGMHDSFPTMTVEMDPVGCLLQSLILASGRML